MFSYQLVRYLEEKGEWGFVEFVIYNLLNLTGNIGNWLAHSFFAFNSPFCATFFRWDKLLIFQNNTRLTKCRELSPLIGVVNLKSRLNFLFSSVTHAIASLTNVCYFVPILNPGNEIGPITWCSHHVLFSLAGSLRWCKSCFSNFLFNISVFSIWIVSTGFLFISALGPKPTQ